MSLIEQCRLTDEALGDIQLDVGDAVLKAGLPHGIIPCDYIRGGAEAQLGKALWVLEEELGCVASPTVEIYIQQVKDWLRAELEAAGMERGERCR